MDEQAASKPASSETLSQPESSSAEAAARTVRSAYTRRNVLWATFQFFFRWFCRFWLRVETSGAENIDATQGGLFLINHQSFLDPLLAAVWLSRPVSYLARDSLFRAPIVGRILRVTHVIPISREAARSGSIRAALERADEGFLVGIFPEGTRNSSDEVQPFRPGFLSLVRRTSVPVYPVGIRGAYRAMPRGAWFIRPVRILVTYGKPIPTQKWRDLDREGNKYDIAEWAREQVAACVGASADRVEPIVNQKEPG